MPTTGCREVFLGPWLTVAVAALLAIIAGQREAACKEPVDLDTVRRTWMRPSQVVPTSPISRDGVSGRVLCGYQGWFNAEGDGAHLRWRHWRMRDPSMADGTRPVVDMLPDVSDLGADERFACTISGSDGQPIELFSSYVRPTVLRHFRWMREHGIDGVFVQRFGVTLGDPELLAHSTKVLGSCRDGALEHGRVYAVMYDLTSLRAGGVEAVLDDWKYLRGLMKIGDDAAALHVDGRPLVAVWGIGFRKDRDYSLAECRRLVAALKADGCAVLCGVPTGWRTLDRDSVADPALHEVVSLCDVVSPWTVGRYGSPEG